MDSIHLLSGKIKTLKSGLNRSFWVNFIVLTIVSICSFVGGFLIGKGSPSSSDVAPVIISGTMEYSSSNHVTNAQNSPIKSSIDMANAQYFASKRGKKYYPINCLSSSKLKEENRVYFNNTTEAQKAGLTSTDSC